MAKISLQELRNIIRKEVRKTLNESDELPVAGVSRIEDAIQGPGATKENFNAQVINHMKKDSKNDNTTSQQLEMLANGYIDTVDGWGAKDFARAYPDWNQKDFQDLCDILGIDWKSNPRPKS